MLARFTQWATAKSLTAGAQPQWVSPDDAERLSAYNLYDQMYRNIDEVFKLQARGTDNKPIYIPNARTIVETTNRFYGKRCTFSIDPSVGSPGDRDAVRLAMLQLFRREKFYSKLAAFKRYSLIHGDALLHIIGDITKPQGKRISIHRIDPGSYFPIYNIDNPDQLDGVHLVDQWEDVIAKKVFSRRTTYRKVYALGATTGITVEVGLFEQDKWDDRDPSKPASSLKLVKQLSPVTLLPPSITAIPVYLVKNQAADPHPFGFSELQGMERILGAVNQAISDEELTLALEGIGVYATTSGPPVDDDGNDTAWLLGPGRVVEHAEGTNFGRVPGVTTILPYTDHINMLMKFLFETSGTPDIAVGDVNVTVAQSGIALALKMGPIIAKNEEKEIELLGTLDQFYYDLLNGWMSAFEGLSQSSGVSINAICDDPMPRDRDSEIKELTALVAAGIISAEYARTRLADLGYEFPDDIAQQILTEQQNTADSMISSYEARVQEELTRGGLTAPATPGAQPGAKPTVPTVPAAGGVIGG